MLDTAEPVAGSRTCMRVVADTATVDHIESLLADGAYALACDGDLLEGRRQFDAAYREAERVGDADAMAAAAVGGGAARGGGGGGGGAAGGAAPGGGPGGARGGRVRGRREGGAAPQPARRPDRGGAPRRTRRGTRRGPPDDNPSQPTSQH